MKGRIIALDRIGRQAAAALMVDGRLEDLLVDPPGDDPLRPGAICRGVVERPMKGQGGLFVRLPGGTGFLRQAGGLAPGQRVIVQVSGVAEPGKAPPVTLRVLFKGGLAIVTPDAPGLNLSRRIRDPGRRAELETLAARVMEAAPSGHGLILRSAAEFTADAEIEAEAAELRDLAAAVMADLEGGPELLVDAPGAQDVALRDWTDPPPDTVEDRIGSFDDLGVTEALEPLRRPAVALAAGASLAIEPTRALVAVDVNTGTDSSPAAGLKANIAAARELPRQLRLRGLGGQVTVDFAPMPKKDRGTVEQVLRAAFRSEAEAVTLAGWTPLGCFEIQRRRDRPPLCEILS
ncbi:MAG: ribonuclease E/G [Gemmobacter sp.]